MPEDDAPAASAEDVWAELRGFVRALGLSDRLAIGGLFFTFFFALAPWKETVEGPSLGIQGLGIPVALAGLSGAGALFFRVRRGAPGLGERPLRWLQLGAAMFAAGWSAIALKLSSDPHLVPAQVGNRLVPASSPSFGVFLALGAAVVALIGTVLGWREGSD